MARQSYPHLGGDARKPRQTNGAEHLQLRSAMSQSTQPTNTSRNETFWEWRHSRYGFAAGCDAVALPRRKRKLSSWGCAPWCGLCPEMKKYLHLSIFARPTLTLYLDSERK